MDMESCTDSVCLFYDKIPELPPPPPIPYFLRREISQLLNSTGGQQQNGDCDLCSWAGYKDNYGESSAHENLPLTSLLVIVAIISALVGASLTACFLSLKRLRNRKKFESTSGSIRHLTRKSNNQRQASALHTLALGSTSGGFASSALATSENTYCEGPYNNDKEPNSVNNIYAEPNLNANPTSSAMRIWTNNSSSINSTMERPPIPPPINENCYLELNDLPIPTIRRCGKCHGHQIHNQIIPITSAIGWQFNQNHQNHHQNHQIYGQQMQQHVQNQNQTEISPEGSSAYYSDLDLALVTSPRMQIARSTLVPVQPQQAIAL